MRGAARERMKTCRSAHGTLLCSNKDLSLQFVRRYHLHLLLLTGGKHS